MVNVLMIDTPPQYFERRAKIGNIRLSFFKEEKKVKFKLGHS